MALAGVECRGADAGVPTAEKDGFCLTFDVGEVDAERFEYMRTAPCETAVEHECGAPPLCEDLLKQVNGP